jgi:SAM-dependent methyltransferase
LNLRNKIETIRRHPSLIISQILEGKSRAEIRNKIQRLDKTRRKKADEKEVYSFIENLKQTSHDYYSSICRSSNRSGNNSLRDDDDDTDQIKLNKLCCIEDWQDNELMQIISSLQQNNDDDYYNKCNGILVRRPGLIHRKDWEWALGIIAMKRFGKLNRNCTAIGVGAGKEMILFYLANQLKHIYATDLYDRKEWENYAPSDFPENPKKYAPFPYREDALTVMRMDGTNLEFPSNTFDVAFSFSSIEHFGGENHSGALKSLMEIERILKPGGIAVAATEYIINGKDAPDLTNQFYNRNTIYSNLIDKLTALKLVQPLDLKITANTLDTLLDAADAVLWDKNKLHDEFKRSHPYILLKLQDILLTSVMLVFQKS